MREPTEVALDTDMETAAAVVVAALLAAVAMLWQLLLISSRREASLLISSRNHITSVLITCVQLLGPKTETEDRPTQATDTDKSLKQNSLHSSVLFFFCELSSNLKIADPFASSAGHVMCNYN